MFNKFTFYMHIILVSGIKDLGPGGDTLENKFVHNYFLGANIVKVPKSVALRIARVNHSCQPNAGAIYDETARVAILFAQKDIQAGEEISICYYASLFLLTPSSIGMSTEEEFHHCKNQLALEYGITCSTDCSCHDPTILDLVKEGRRLFATVIALTHQRRIEEALAAGDELLDIYRRLNASSIYRSHAEVLLFRAAVTKSEFLPKAMQYIRPAVEFFQKICPYSECLTKTYEKLLEHPETDPNYMKIDKEQNMLNFMENVFGALNL